MDSRRKNNRGSVLLLGCLAAAFVMLVAAVVTGVALELPLGASLLLFGIYAVARGFSVRETVQMMWSGAKKSMLVVQVMLVIGMLTASWFLSGTIPYLVKLGIRMIMPKLFLLCAFLICAAMSTSIGTSFGTANTLGVVLMVIARGSGINPAMAAGAIASGIFVGDRCSPMSSSLVLLSTVTGTELYKNSKMCFRTMAVPMVVSMGIYAFLSFLHPMDGTAGNMEASIEESFCLTPWLLIPIVVIFLLCFWKVPIKITMICSIVSAVILAVLVQRVPAASILRGLLLGFALPENAPCAEIMHGGGLMSMVSTCVIVLLSCMITSILEETHSMDALMQAHGEASSLKRYLKTLVTGFASAAIGCNQTVGIIMTSALRSDAYPADDREAFARDISIAGSIVPSMVPWSIAIFTPIHSLGFEGLGYYPYMVLMHALVLWGCVLAKGHRTEKNPTVSCGASVT